MCTFVFPGNPKIQYMYGKTYRPSVELQKAVEQPRSFRLGSGLPLHRPDGERGEAEGEPGLDGS